jgi:hypothetical protein
LDYLGSLDSYIYKDCSLYVVSIVSSFWLIFIVPNSSPPCALMIYLQGVRSFSKSVLSLVYLTIYFPRRKLSKAGTAYSSAILTGSTKSDGCLTYVATNNLGSSTRAISRTFGHYDRKLITSFSSCFRYGTIYIPPSYLF